MAHILPCFLCVKYNIANNALPLCLDSHNPSSLTNQVNSITNRFEIKYIVTFHSIPGTVYPLPPSFHLITQSVMPTLETAVCKIQPQRSSILSPSLEKLKVSQVRLSAKQNDKFPIVVWQNICQIQNIG